jgi:hypothetical protein
MSTATAAPAPPVANVTDDPGHSTEYVHAWRATSRRHPHLSYTVTYDRLRNHWECQCAGYHYRGHCWHVDQAINAVVAEWRGKGAWA